MVLESGGFEVIRNDGEMQCDPSLCECRDGCFRDACV